MLLNIQKKFRRPRGKKAKEIEKPVVRDPYRVEVETIAAEAFVSNIPSYIDEVSLAKEDLVRKLVDGIVSRGLVSFDEKNDSAFNGKRIRATINVAMPRLW